MAWNELLGYLREGGLTMVFLLAASLLAIAVAVERTLFLWGVSEAARDLGQRIKQHLLNNQIRDARDAAARSNALVGDVFLAGFSRLQPELIGTLASVVERERAQLMLKLRKNLWILATLGAVTPFVGLFGTVAGIMKSFKDLGIDVQAGGVGGSAEVMAGISEALIATAVGILVAVEAVVLFNYFQSRLGRVAVELRLASEEFVELLQLRWKAMGPIPEASVEPSKGGEVASWR